jgi:hypothetical protein
MTIASANVSICLLNRLATRSFGSIAIPPATPP